MELKEGLFHLTGIKDINNIEKGHESDEDEDMGLTAKTKAGEVKKKVSDIKDDAAIRVKDIKRPKEPTEDEKRMHRIAHYPPAYDWCPECIATARDDPHRRQKKDEKEDVDRVPVVLGDWGYLGEGEGSLPMVVLWDENANYIGSTGTNTTSSTERSTTRYVESFIDDVGHVRCITQSDQESSFIDTWKELKEIKARGQGQSEQISIRQAPRGSHSSQGGVENAVQIIRRGFTVQKLALENKLKCFSEITKQKC